MAPPRLGDGSVESFVGEIDGSGSCVEENDGLLKLFPVTGGGT